MIRAPGRQEPFWATNGRFSFKNPGGIGRVSLSWILAWPGWSAWLGGPTRQNRVESWKIIHLMNFNTFPYVLIRVWNILICFNMLFHVNLSEYVALGVGREARHRKQTGNGKIINDAKRLYKHAKLFNELAGASNWFSRHLPKGPPVRTRGWWAILVARHALSLVAQPRCTFRD